MKLECTSFAHPSASPAGRVITSTRVTPLRCVWIRRHSFALLSPAKAESNRGDSWMQQFLSTGLWDAPTWTFDDVDVNLFQRHGNDPSPQSAQRDLESLLVSRMVSETLEQEHAPTAEQEDAGPRKTIGDMASQPLRTMDGQTTSDTSACKDQETSSGHASRQPGSVHVAAGDSGILDSSSVRQGSRDEQSKLEAGVSGTMQETRKSEAGEGVEAGQATSLLLDVGPEKEPVVYRTEYNVKFLGLEKLHPFDSAKWGRVIDFLLKDGRLKADQVVSPQAATESDLLRVHTREYMNSLNSSSNVAAIAELPFVSLVPSPLVQKHLLQPFRYQVGGTVVAAKLALERGWALNVGGGFHHSCSYRGGGFCVYADITLAIKFARQHLGVQRVMIIDLDAHQGNGHERDFLQNPGDTYILDMYNADIYPKDHKAKAAISLKVELRSGMGTQDYIAMLRENIQLAFQQFQPQLVMYNAGTDVLDGDPLGCLRVSPKGVICRDQIVFSSCRERNVPIVMLTSGGYQRNNAQVIADSIGNLADSGLISLCKRTEPAVGGPVQSKV